MGVLAPPGWGGATETGESEQDIRDDCDRQRAEILARGDELRRRLDETEKAIKGASVYSDPDDLSVLVTRRAALVTLLELVQPALNRVEEERARRIAAAREPRQSEFDRLLAENMREAREAHERETSVLRHQQTL